MALHALPTAHRPVRTGAALVEPCRAVVVMTSKPMSEQINSATVVHLLAARPELRGAFPVADVIDALIREGV